MRSALALGLMVASGFAALGYQIVWTQQCALWLGHETAAVLAVVAAFFGGLALGAWGLGARIERSTQPARWYAACEAVIGGWGLVLALGLMSPAAQGLLALTGAQPGAAWQWAVAFVGTFLLLLPATAAMGATLPAMERTLAAWRGPGGALAALYAGNTLGAVLGVLAAAFWLVPTFGLVRTAIVCVLLNVACAALAWRLASAAATPSPPRATAARTSWPWRLAATGCLGIGYEVLVVRVLSQVAENTVYTFAMLLAVYLVGTALGAAAWQRWRQRAHDADADTQRDRLLWALAIACLLGTLSLWGAESVKAWALQAAGLSLASALAAEALLALLAFLPPTLVMGALFSQLCVEALDRGVGFGSSLAVNTLGAALAPPLFGVLLVPALGPKAALLLVAAGYLLLVSRRGLMRPLTGITAGVVAALALWAPPLAFVEVPEGGRVVSYHEGAMAAVSVVEDADGVSRLRINNRQQEGASDTLVADARQALLPLLLHPAPRRALFLGLGTGVTASSAAQDAQLQVDAVELLPEVIDASRHFTQALIPPPQRLHAMAADARRFVRASDRQYDLIVADNFHPARSGSGSLYTVEHFQAIRERLAADGLFCQWLPLHQLDLPTLRSVVRSFIAVNPGAWALLATNSLDTPVLGLLARRDGGRFELAAVRERLNSAALPRPPTEFGLHDELALLGSFVAGPDALARFAADAELNTDDLPVVTYRAPRITYAPDSLPRDRLIALLHELQLAPGDVIDERNTDAAWAPRLAAYWRARNRFIEAGRDVKPSADARRMLAQVREPLLDVLRTSPDFRPARDPLLRMADALARHGDADGARALLNELKQTTGR